MAKLQKNIRHHYLFLGSRPFLILVLFFLLFFNKRGEAIFPDYKANGIFIGPEFYYIHREREGGTEQRGGMFGARLGYERIKRHHVYLGLDGLFASGKLTGHSASGLPIKSELTDAVVEGRIGYTFQYKYGLKAFLTPYIGGGYFYEKNNFVNPTPLSVTFKDTFKYFATGVFTGLQFNNQWNFGINFKIKYMVDSKSKVSNDPDFDDITLLMEDECQYRVEVPISYQFCRKTFRLETGIVPFFEYRHFGGRENFPFDFIDTKFHLWGARWEFVYRF